MDGAFLSDTVVTMLDAKNVEYTLSVPFERFVELKTIIANRQRWQPMNQPGAYFELETQELATASTVSVYPHRGTTTAQRTGPARSVHSL